MDKKAFKMVFATFVVLVAGCMALCWATEAAAGLFGWKLADQESVEAVRRMAGWNWPFVYFIAYVAIAAPVVEETLFRCGFFTWPQPARPARAAIVSSLAFSAVHYLFAGKPDNAFVALFFFGLVQCRLYAKTGRLWHAMLTHSMFNIVNLAVALTTE